MIRHDLQLLQFSYNTLMLHLSHLHSGRISVVFMHASGTLSLRAYNAELADRALQLYENVGQVGRKGGRSLGVQGVLQPSGWSQQH
jgi:hypothetical protein